MRIQITALIVGGPDAGKMYNGDKVNYIVRHKFDPPQPVALRPWDGDAMATTKCQEYYYVLQELMVGDPHEPKFFFVPSKYDKDGGWWLTKQLIAGYRQLQEVQAEAAAE